MHQQKPILKTLLRKIISKSADCEEQTIQIRALFDKISNNSKQQIQQAQHHRSKVSKQDCLNPKFLVELSECGQRIKILMQELIQETSSLSNRNALTKTLAAYMDVIYEIRHYHEEAHGYAASEFYKTLHQNSSQMKINLLDQLKKQTQKRMKAQQELHWMQKQYQEKLDRKNHKIHELKHHLDQISNNEQSNNQKECNASSDENIHRNEDEASSNNDKILTISNISRSTHKGKGDKITNQDCNLKTKRHHKNNSMHSQSHNSYGQFAQIKTTIAKPGKFIDVSQNQLEIEKTQQFIESQFEETEQNRGEEDQDQQEINSKIKQEIVDENIIMKKQIVKLNQELRENQQKYKQMEDLYRELQKQLTEISQKIIQGVNQPKIQLKQAKQIKKKEQKNKEFGDKNKNLTKKLTLDEQSSNYFSEKKKQINAMDNSYSNNGYKSPPKSTGKRSQTMLVHQNASGKSNSNEIHSQNEEELFRFLLVQATTIEGYLQDEQIQDCEN